MIRTRQDPRSNAKASRKPSRSGVGQLLASGERPIKVRYAIDSLGFSNGQPIIGTLKGNYTRLCQMWLIPVVILRLSDGKRLSISITDLSLQECLFQILT